VLFENHTGELLNNTAPFSRFVLFENHTGELLNNTAPFSRFVLFENHTGELLNNTTSKLSKEQKNFKVISGDYQIHFFIACPFASSERPLAASSSTAHFEGTCWG
jgi:hypothetical protein